MSGEGRARQLTVEGIIAVRTPESPAWSPDGTLLAYRLAGFEYGEIWLSVLTGEPRPLTSGDEPTGRPVWQDEQHVLFTRGNAVCRVTVGGDEEETLLALPEEATRAAILPSADGAVYILDGDAWLWVIGAPEPVRMTRGQWLMTRMVHRIIDLIEPAPDGRHIAIVCPREQCLDLAVYSRETGELHSIMPSEDVEAAPVWSPDGSKLAFTRWDWEVKWRELYVVNPDGSDPVRIWRDESERWVSRFQFDCAFSPHANYLAFVAPLDDFGQLLVAKSDGSSQPVQMSGPGAEAEMPRWSPDGDWLAYICSERHEKRLYAVNTLHRSDRRDVIKQSYVAADYTWSPMSLTLAAIISTYTAPDHLALARVDGDSGKTIANHEPSRHEILDDLVVSATRVRSEDDHWDVPMLVMRRHGLPADGSAPAVVYVHGGGQGQYALAGWQGYTGAGTVYAANLMLALRGYVVAIVDYRGSWGYGRSYETASHLDVGGGDLRDVVAAAQWLAKQPQVDEEKIGVWGRSYGGFMTTLCMVREPDLFKAGVNLVGVFNWVDYYHYLSDRGHGAWSRSRFERPEDHPDLYRERNPLEYIDNLAGPYLALYGNDDANVPIDHCWMLVRALTDADKDFDLVVYPDEPHIFTRAATWRDALRRTARFFDEHLRAE